MKVGDYCKRGVVTVPATADAVEIAETMRDEHVGFLVVIEDGDPDRRPIGVITDRDIVLQVCARDVDLHAVTAVDLMSRDPLVAREDDDLAEALQAMRLAGFRRIPVTKHNGALCGVLAIDDAIEITAGLLCDITGSIRNEQRQERRLRAT
jgi:CBS domain-containing protein